MRATNVKLEQADLESIRDLIYKGTTDRPSSFEVEYAANGYTLYLNVEHEFDTRTVRGGSYEGYDFERLTEVYNERFDILNLECLDSDGESITCDPFRNDLLNILN